MHACMLAWTYVQASTAIWISDWLFPRLTAKLGRKTIVGFGDWSSRDAGGFLRTRGPVKKLTARLTSRCRVEIIDEFHTPASCNACGQSMINAYCHKDAKQNPHGQSGNSGRVNQVLI